MKYTLTFLIPTSATKYQEFCRFESDTPFPVIQRGDLIDPRNWQSESFDRYMQTFKYGDLMRAETIYHHITQEKDGSYGNHTIDIFTEIVKK